jgi:hypothetical protein
VSEKDLPLIRVHPVEVETGGKRTPALPQSLDGRDPAAITGDLKLARTGDPHFDLVAFFQLQSLDHVAFERTEPAWLRQAGSPGKPYSRCPVTGAIPAWLAANAPITGIWKVLPW